MSTFDTHGGYFAPQNYTKINAGGSHEENPNGGVQLGVDAQGIPNMLEEGEPVYDDFVFSDNIKAEGGFLKENNLPEMYAGMFYSDIAGAYVKEAEERPLNSISNNGLEAMLKRVAQAQEMQKQAKERRELERELSKLSPEELAELEAMLSSRGGEEEQMQEPMQQEEMQEPAVSPMQQQVPVMAYGGYLRKFEDGTPGEVVEDETEQQATTEPEWGTPERPLPMYIDEDTFGYSDLLGTTDNINGRYYRYEPYPQNGLISQGSGIHGPEWLSDARLGWEKFTNSGPLGAVIDALIPSSGSDLLFAASTPLLRTVGAVGQPIIRTAGRGAKSFLKGVGRRFSQRGKMLRESKEAIREASAVSTKAHAEANALASKLKTAEADLKANPASKELQTTVENLREQVRVADRAAIKAGAKTAGQAVKSAGKTAAAVTVGPMYNAEEVSKGIAETQKVLNEKQAALKAAKTAKGKKNPATIKKLEEEVAAAQKEFDKASSFWTRVGHVYWDKAVALPALGAYGAHKIGEAKADNWKGQQFANGGPMNMYEAGSQVEIQDPPYGVLGYNIDPRYYVWMASGEGQRPDNYVIDPGRAARVAEDERARAADAARRAAEAAEHTSGGGKRTRKKTESVLSNPVPQDNNIGRTPQVEFNVPEETIPDIDLTGLEFDDALDPEVQAYIDSLYSPKEVDKVGQIPYPTGLRYYGALQDAVLGLYNALQEPDKYTMGEYTPIVPNARMPFIDPKYGALDVNLGINEALAEQAAAQRALQNSGLGPTLGAAMTAADAGFGKTIGDIRTKYALANNSMYNDVVEKRNALSEKTGMFDYQQDKDRATILNEAARQKLLDDLALLKLNYGSETEKYAAMQTTAESVKKALSDMGYQNFVMNQVNGNPALLQYLLANGMTQFKGTGNTKD